MVQGSMDVGEYKLYEAADTGAMGYQVEGRGQDHMGLLLIDIRWELPYVPDSCT